MHEIMKERIGRKLEALPPEQLYQVLDYIEFLEAKYAQAKARQPDALQRFAERLEDGMRIRSVAPKVISGTFGLLGSARRVLRTVSDAGRDMLADVTAPAPRPAERPAVNGGGDRPAPPPRPNETEIRGP